MDLNLTESIICDDTRYVTRASNDKRKYKHKTFVRAKKSIRKSPDYIC